MSTWNLGIGDVSEETHALRNKLSSKEGQIAAQQDRLVRQAAEIQELSNALNEALYKLGNESERALQLETDIKQRSEDFRNEQIALQNVQAALAAAQGRVKDNGLETRGLQVMLEAISHTSDEHKNRGDRLEREKYMLDARVKELESELREAPQQLPTTTPNRRGIHRPRSSSLSSFKVTTLEQDLVEARTCLATKDTELRTVHQRLTQVQNNLIRVDNEKLAMERKFKGEVGELQAFLEEKEEELTYLKKQQGDAGREEELLRRIDEDDAKIEALEMMLRGAEDSKQLKEKLQRVEDEVWKGQKYLAELEERQIELIREKEEALDELEEARRDIVGLEKRLRDRDTRDRGINERASKMLESCDNPLMMMDDSCVIDMETLEPQPLSPVPASMPASETDANVVTHIERLLAAIDRLRDERDSLRRDVQFLESESRFTIEALEARLSASVSSASDKTVATIGQLKAEMDELHSHLAEISERNAATIEFKNFEIKRLGLAVQALAVTLDHTSSQAKISETCLLLLAQDELQASQDDVMEKERHLKNLETRLDATILNHKTAMSQRDGSLAELQHKNSQVEKDLETAATSERETREQLENVLDRMSEVTIQLQDVESERDDLRLQITNLMTDMQNIQEELTNAESRYTSLQFHQLSNMTNNEATRNLQEQIEELEHRVMRRTEQVGIHQHDIKRLETNLRLQEERLGEMTTELEMMAAQKDAMVEDCADAREARDEALIRVERLEEELECLEGRNIDNTLVIENLIATIAQTVCRAREAIRLTREEVAGTRGTLAQSMVIQQLQEKEAALHKSIEESQNEIGELTTTLSQCQTEVKHLSALTTSVQQENVELVSQLEKGRLQAQSHGTTINDLRRLNQELRGSLQEQQLSRPDVDDAEQKLVQLKLEHAETIGVLQARLVKTSSDLEEVQTRYTSVQDAHQRAVQEANSSNLELEQRLEVAVKKLAELEQLREQYHDLKKEHAEQLSRVQEELNNASRSYQDLQCSRDALQDENVRLTEDLTHTQREHAKQVGRFRDENRVIQQELEQKVSSLQGKFEEQGRLLDISKREAARICDRLQEEVEGRAQDKKQHAIALLSEKETNEDAVETISQLRGELETFEENLQQTNVHLQSVEHENVTLQQQMTAMEAEIQRSKSLSRYLEIQIKESDQLVASLKSDIECAKADLARSEKSWKAAEVNLSLQNAQHKREMTEVQRELSAFRLRPNFEQALAELEERNSEMEELLRNKCAEIEENDDRALEMLKEKKKLTTKVESLTRKVQNLQVKLTAAKASNPIPESQPTPPAPSLPLTSSTPQPTSAPISRLRSATVSSAPIVETPSTSRTRNPSNRVVSGPSFLPRPKTPEVKAVRPVFKARTPERQMQPEVPLPPLPVIGKKRAVPDDFEAYENLPAQAFTADGEDVENKTPQVRRVLNSLQSGFTPVRNQSSRPTVAMPSPRRGAPSRTSPLISDLTNSPHHLNPSSAKPSKRSWLGKIRGNSQGTDKPSLFERGGA